MLREIGVKNIKLQEVFGLDEACLAQLPFVNSKKYARMDTYH